MLRRLIGWSVDNRLIVLILTVAAIAGGVWAVRETPLEALPDLSDVQVIVQAEYGEQAPRIVEDQVTYPIAAEMLKVPGATTVRGYSYFGISFVYVIFDDNTDLYWARARVLEYLNGLKGKLPSTVTPTLGPDATGLGWIYQYALEDTTGRLDLAQLRSVQDWYLRYALTAVPGVSEVATVGGFEKQYQIDLDPAKLLAYGVPITRVMSAVQNANADVGAMVMELSARTGLPQGNQRHRERRRGRHGHRHADSCCRAGSGKHRAGGTPRNSRSGRTWRCSGWHCRDALWPERADDDRERETEVGRGPERTAGGRGGAPGI